MCVGGHSVVVWLLDLCLTVLDEPSCEVGRMWLVLCAHLSDFPVSAEANIELLRVIS